MKAREYRLLKECVERGLQAGWHKAHKYADKPTPAQIWDTQEVYVMADIAEWFNFRDDYEDRT